jgi:hypothetical protein
MADHSEPGPRVESSSRRPQLPSLATMEAELSTFNASTERIATNPQNDAADTNPQIPDNLPPMDRGRQAWTFCISASVLELLVWGYGFSFGVFQDWYTSHPPFQGQSPIAISAIGATILGIPYFEGVGLMAIIQRRPEWI